MGIRILGTGSYFPPKVVKNTEIAASLDTGETTSSMAAKAATHAMEAAGAKPEEIGLVVVATSTPDYATFPSTACLVQGLLGCKDAGAYDLQAACAGFVYALEQARGFVTLHPDRKAVVIGAECLSRILDWSDRAICILFGDGAGAVVIGSDGETGGSSCETILGADASGRHFIQRTGGTMTSLELDPVTGVPRPTTPVPPKMSLMGHDVFVFAVKTMSRITEQLCERRGITPADLDRVWSGALADGAKIVLVGFGAGLVFGGTYMQWPNL